MLHSTAQWRKNGSGFTLVELVGTIAIISILAFVALPRFFDRSSFDVRVFGDQLQVMLQHAQKLAVAQNRNVYVQLNGTRFAFCFDVACTDKVVSPAVINTQSAATRDKCGGTVADGPWMCEGLPSGVQYAVTPSTTGFFFNALGKPFALSDLPPISSFTSSPVHISLSAGGDVRDVFIEPETGYVHP